MTLWASTNKLLLNLLKTKEMVFHRPNPRSMVFPPVLLDIERVESFRLLGIQFHKDLQFSEYFSTLITVCNQRLYLLTQLKKQGLGLSETDIVFKAIVLSKIIYALPMLIGYFTEGHIQQVCSIFKKAKRWQLTTDEYDFRTIAQNLQYNLFQQSKSSSHCLYHLYTPNLNTSATVLRDRGHRFHVPGLKYDFNSKIFIIKCLIQYRYI